MTYIEFVDNCAIENLCAELTYPADRVILVGCELEILNKHCSQYSKIMAAKGMNTSFVPVVVSDDSLKAVVTTLEELVKKEVEGGEECVIDLTGGNDLHLTAAGIVYGKLFDEYKGINLVRFDVVNRTVIDEDGDGLPEFPRVPDITVEDNVSIYGGRVIYEKEKKGTTHRWNVDDRLIKDVSALWEICRKNSEWNVQTSLLETVESDSVVAYKRGNVTECDLQKLDMAFNESGKNGDDRSAAKHSNGISATFLDKLVAAGFLKEYSLTGGRLKLVYRDGDAKRYITKSGQALEMAVFVAVSCMKNPDGTKKYGDVMTGVTIDWDGKIVEKNGYSADSAWYLNTKKDTKNEIDVFAMKGMVPIFISCKNGRVEMEELYKLDTVAKRFGGKYGQKILVAPNLNKRNQFTWELLARAKDMGIKVLYENVRKNTVFELQGRLDDVIDSCFKKK